MKKYILSVLIILFAFPLFFACSKEQETPKKAETFTITAGCNSFGFISHTGKKTYSKGENAVYMFAAYENLGDSYQVVDVLLDGVSVLSSVSDNSYMFYNISTNHTLYVEFGLVLNVTIAEPFFGDIELQTSVINWGKPISFIITPNEGYELKTVSIERIDDSVTVVNTFTLAQLKALPSSSILSFVSGEDDYLVTYKNPTSHFVISAVFEAKMMDVVAYYISPVGTYESFINSYVQYGETLADILSTIDHYYTFAGWFDENGDEVALSTVVSDSLNLTAKYLADVDVGDDMGCTVQPGSSAVEFNDYVYIYITPEESSILSTLVIILDLLNSEGLVVRETIEYAKLTGSDTYTGVFNFECEIVNGYMVLRINNLKHDLNISALMS